MNKLFRHLGFLWRRAGDASLFAWLFPSAWTTISIGFVFLATTATGLLTQSPPIVWIPGALTAAVLARIFLMLWHLPQPVQRQPKSIEQLADEDLYKQVSKWLANRLSKKELNVRNACLFGSIVHSHYPTSDVDLIVEYCDMSDNDIAFITRKIKTELASEFKRTFGHELHVTFFCSTENDRKAEFIAKAGKHEVLYTTD